MESVDTECRYSYTHGYGFELREGKRSHKVNDQNPGTVRSMVDNLSPYTRYDCWGSIKNVAGRSTMDIPIPVFTKEDGSLIECQFFV